VDDPHSVDQAESDAERRTAVEWFSGTMSTRLNDLATGHKVVIQQRLHEDDLTGDLLAKGGFEWLCLPAEFEPERRCSTPIWSDPRVEPGELLWPDKVTAAQLESLQNSLGSYRYAGQYQQRPAPASGGIFQRHWPRFWKPAHMDLPPVPVRMPDGQVIGVHAIPLPEEFDTQIQSWDLAFKDKASSDYAVGQVWGAKGADRFLLDQRRERMDMPATKNAIRSMSAKWPKAAAKLVEDKANGPAVIQELQHEISGLIEVTPEGGKLARAHAVSPQVESGNVYLPHPAICSWVEAFIEELMTFPNSRHDDQVDAMTQALNRLRTMRGSLSAPESEIVVPPMRSTPDSWPQVFAMVVTPTVVAALWGAWDPNGVIYLYAEHVMPHGEPAENARAIKRQGDWIPGILHVPSITGWSIEKSRISELYRQQGLRVTGVKMGEETGVYHLWQLLAAQKLKVFNTLTRFLSEYRVGDEGAPLLQCCRALLVSGRHYMRARPEPEMYRMPPPRPGPNSWMG
ncbi:MAG TPA: phage terminase large subunit, partial [Bryobacteraceae bacterium]|nr:phage terminase large subunit [Bryobacteraceae bacterium]